MEKNQTLFNKNILERILNSLEVYKDKEAFYIEEKFYTYEDLSTCIKKVKNRLEEISDTHIALVANDDLETYASIIALWLEGKCYIPLNPNQPIERCLSIVEQVGTKYIFDSSEVSRYKDQIIIGTKHLDAADNIKLKSNDDISDDALAYILFTSGSTGIPKGVPISRKNLASFVDAFWSLGYELSEKDHCLQMFDLTFDLSVQSYLIPMLVGATTYTVSPARIKYEAVFELIDEHELTFTLMVPSVIHHLMPYLDEIYAPSIKYALFAGEALLENEVEKWSKCIPNARIDNVYGPTENTIYCTCYTYNRDSVNKSVGGVLSIGKPMPETSCIIVDENNKLLQIGEKGELCLSGIQLTEGYWENPEKNREAFFVKDDQIFYHTGDICSIDSDNDIMYYGRCDSQVKIQGYRIELGEIEYHANIVLNKAISVAVVISDNDSQVITLCIESESKITEKVLNYLKGKVPSYMIPHSVYYFKQFPLNVNGKIDRRKLKEVIELNVKENH